MGFPFRHDDAGGSRGALEGFRFCPRSEKRSQFWPLRIFYTRTQSQVIQPTISSYRCASEFVLSTGTRMSASKLDPSICCLTVIIQRRPRCRDTDISKSGLTLLFRFVDSLISFC